MSNTPMPALMRRLSPLVLLLLASACPQPERQPAPQPPVDTTAWLFPDDDVLDVAITMPPEDWERLREQSSGFSYVTTADCPAGPRPDPYDWMAATVKVGDTAETSVHVRKKGFFGSINPLKPSLVIRPQQSDTIHGLLRMTLNNNLSDGSHLRQCLTYKLFRDAGLAAPRCALARVSVNGADLGVFSHVENINEGMLARWFNDASGTLYEAAISDFAPGWSANFDVKGGATPQTQAALDRVITALDAEDDALLSALDGVIDLDQFMSFWALEVLTLHWDGYNGNFGNAFMYLDPADQRFRFMPWGVDTSLFPPTDWGALFEPSLPGLMPQSVFANSALARRLYAHPEGKALYLARLQSMLDAVWHEADLHEWLDARSAIAATALSAAVQPSAAHEVETVHELIDDRRLRIQRDIDNGGAVWTRPARAVPCFEQVRLVQGHFQAVWRNNSNGSFGQGGVLVESGGDNVNTCNNVEAVATPDTRAPDLNMVQLIVRLSPLSDGRSGELLVTLPRSALTPSRVALDSGVAHAVYTWIDTDTASREVAGIVVDGTLEFTEVDAQDGGMIRGEVTAPVWMYPILP